MGNRIKNLIPLLLFLTFLLTTSANASECKPWVAMAISIQGTAQLRVANDGQESWQSVQLGSTFCTKDVLRVRENSRVALILNNDTIVRLDENTTITFSNLSPDSDSWMDLKKGIAHFISRVKQAFKVITPFVNASIEGTEFVVAVAPEQAEVTVFEGKVKAENDKGQVVLTRGQTAVALQDQAPILKTRVKPRDAVQWAIYYPTIITQADIDPKLEPEIRDKMAQSMMLNARGKATDALNIIDDLPGDIPNASFYAYRAALRLAVGRVEKATKDIDQALTINSDDSDALALKSIIAIVQNRNDEALSLAQQAVKNNPDNVSAYLALSYANQAQFDLVAAQQTINKAPESALINSRRAELFLMQGDFDNALEYALKARNKNPDSSHTQTVLGFTHLIRIDTDNARKSFNQAIKLEQTNPLAHLGLGLAMIRDGELKQGRREMEYAASLDPNNSLIRSYLGKAYYEESRNKIAADQFDMAKKLDPNDPTPWFYDAIRKQNENDLSGGLKDLQKSIELNDNRAVYRSKLLLDSDDAARSTSVANLYRDVGFEQLGLLEAKKSLNQDPTNYSAHRFLADSYLTQPRHEIARVSELMQSQLLQPLNILPVQPQLAESSLGIVHGTGGIRPGYSEYNSLFMRDQFAFFANGLAGTFGTRANDVVLSGLVDNFSYSLGTYHYYSRGFRENNDQDFVIDNAFLQVAMTPNASAQFEYRKFKHIKGDTSLKFNQDDFSRTFRESTNSEVYRIGLAYQHTNRSKLIGSIVNENLSIEQYDADNIPVQDSSLDGDGTLYEVQHIYSADYWNLISGIGSFSAETKSKIELDFNPLPCLVPSCLINETFKETHDNAYVYSNINIKSYTFTLGVSANSVDNEIADFNETSPKIGLQWQISPTSTIRAAYFKVLTRDLLTDQTIEPTNVAGFNQFFDDSISTKSTVNGLAFDTSLSKNLFTGLNVFTRELEVPVESFGDTIFYDWDEINANGYLNWVTSKNSSLSLNVNYLELERPIEYAFDFVNLKTYTIPLELNLYFANGIKFNINVTYVNQEGDYSIITPPTISTYSGKDEFAVLNSEFRFKLAPTNNYIIIGAKNILDEDFNYYEIDTANPSISPERFSYIKAEFGF